MNTAGNHHGHQGNIFYHLRIKLKLSSTFRHPSLMISGKFQFRIFVTLKDTGSLNSFKIFQAILSQMSFNCSRAVLSVCIRFKRIEDWLELFLTSRQIRLPSASEIFLGRPVFFSFHCIRIYNKFAITTTTNFNCDDTLRQILLMEL